MNDLTPAIRKSPQTISSVPPLSDKLNALLLESSNSPVIGPKAAAALRGWLDAIDDISPPRLPGIEQVEAMISRLSLATKERPTTAEETKERLDVYWRALREIPNAYLTRAFDTLVRSLKWMPTPAEIHTEAMRHKAKAEYRVSRARHLVWKHEREWKPEPTDLVSAEDIARIKADVAATFTKQEA